MCWVALALGCGGKSESQTAGHGDTGLAGAEQTSFAGAADGVSGAASAGSGDTAGAPSAGQANAGAGGSSGSPSAGAPSAGAESAGASGSAGDASTAAQYVPDAIAPFDPTYLSGGSFEMSNGSGWDTCYSHTPGVVKRVSGNASNGSTALEFAACSGCASATDPSSSQVYLWFAKQPDTAMSLYFDIMNLDVAAPRGELRLEMTNSGCMTLAPLATIPLADLTPNQTWQTRCVDLPILAPDAALGLAVTGASYDIALDSLRLGPHCHFDLHPK